MPELSEDKLWTPELRHFGIVVRDLDASMKKYREIMGMEEWQILDSQEAGVTDTTYHGKPVKHSFRVGIANMGPVRLELIQPVEGDNICRDFLEEQGQGLHHVGHIWVKDMDEAIKEFEEQGFCCLQTGRLPAGRWAYIDMTEKLGFVAECAQPTIPIK